MGLNIVEMYLAEQAQNVLNSRTEYHTRFEKPTQDVPCESCHYSQIYAEIQRLSGREVCVFAIFKNQS